MANCSDCGKRIKSIFQDGKDYFYKECHVCNQYVCDDCSDYDDDTGESICLYCITDKLIQEKKITIGN